MVEPVRYILCCRLRVPSHIRLHLAVLKSPETLRLAKHLKSQQNGLRFLRKFEDHHLRLGLRLRRRCRCRVRHIPCAMSSSTIERLGTMERRSLPASSSRARKACENCRYVGLRCTSSRICIELYLGERKPDALVARQTVTYAPASHNNACIPMSMTRLLHARHGDRIGNHAPESHHSHATEMASSNFPTRGASRPSRVDWMT